MYEVTGHRERTTPAWEAWALEMAEATALESPASWAAPAWARAAATAADSLAARTAPLLAASAEDPATLELAWAMVNEIVSVLALPAWQVQPALG